MIWHVVVVSFNSEYGPSLFDNRPKERISLTISTHKTRVCMQLLLIYLICRSADWKFQSFLFKERDIVCPVPPLSLSLFLECKEILKYAWVTLIVHYLEDEGLNWTDFQTNLQHTHSTHMLSLSLSLSLTHTHTQTHTHIHKLVLFRGFWMIMILAMLILVWAKKLYQWQKMLKENIK